MQDVVSIPRFKKNLTMMSLVKASAHFEVQQYLDKLGRAIYLDSIGLDKEEQIERLQSEYDFCLNDIQESLKRWDEAQVRRYKAFDDAIDRNAYEFYHGLVRKYCAKTKKNPTAQLKKMDAWRDKEKCKCWGHEYDRLAILFYMLFMEVKRKGLRLSNSLKIAIRNCYGSKYPLYVTTSPQEKRIASLQENKEKAKGPERKRIMGLVIDNLLMETGEQTKSAESNTRHVKRDTKVHLKRAESNAIDRWSKYSPNKKKMKASRRQHQNVRRRYFPKGIRGEPVIQFVVRKIKQGDTAELRECKIKLKGMEETAKTKWAGKTKCNEYAVTVAKAEVLYESIEMLYKSSLPEGAPKHIE